MKKWMISGVCFALAMGSIIPLYQQREKLPEVVVSAEKKAVIVSGQEVWYLEKGTGIPILVLVGWGGPTDDYFPIQNTLVNRGYRVLLPDLPGLPGKTSSTFIPLAGWSNWIEEFGKAAIGEQFVIMSHSLSAQMALQCLSKESSKCRGGILVSPWLVSSSSQKIFWRFVAKTIRPFCPIVYKNMEWVKDGKGWETALDLFSVAEVQPRVPCLVLWGKRDLVKHLFTGWEESHFETRHYDWDHSPQIRATEELADVIDEFIRSEMGNIVIVIKPYWYQGTWVFDDESVGLKREPFVAGIPEMIDNLVKDITNARSGFRLLFSSAPFPGYQIELTRVKEEYGGYWYRMKDQLTEGWLCPALFRYFETAPETIYVKAEQL
jgi:pimeloyl-ACP methyl ester carboxylesterase